MRIDLSRTKYFPALGAVVLASIVSLVALGVQRRRSQDAAFPTTRI